jgi:hypothetical protein
MAALIPGLPPFHALPTGARLGLLILRAKIAAEYAATHKLPADQKEQIERLFWMERCEAMLLIKDFLDGLLGLDRAHRQKRHDQYESLTERTENLLRKSLNENTAHERDFDDLTVELTTQVFVGIAYDSGNYHDLRFSAESPQADVEKAHQVPAATSTPQTEIPADIISSDVAITEYNVSRTTIRRAVKDGRLKDYRPEHRADNSPFQLSRAEVAARWRKRGQ